MVEMNVGHDRHRRTFDDVRQARGVAYILAGNPHDLATGHREAVHLLERRVDVGGIGRRHRLHGDRMVSADPHAFRVGFVGLVFEEDRFRSAPQAKHMG